MLEILNLSKVLITYLGIFRLIELDKLDTRLAMKESLELSSDSNLEITTSTTTTSTTTTTTSSSSYLLDYSQESVDLNTSSKVDLGVLKDVGVR